MQIRYIISEKKQLGPDKEFCVYVTLKNNCNYCKKYHI